MHPLTQLIYHDMKPALGVTEPGAIAFAVAKAKARWYSWLLSEPISRQFASQNVCKKQLCGLDYLLLQNPEETDGRSFREIKNLENWR